MTNSLKRHDMIFETDNGWKLVDVQDASRQVVLWESSNLEECQHALVMRKAIQEKAKHIKALLKNNRATYPGPQDIILKLKGSEISVWYNEEKIGNGTFQFASDWELAVTAGLPEGAMTVGNIHIDEGWRKKGIAKSMHQVIINLTGLPTVPNAINGAPGSISEDAELFWKHRVAKINVPGLDGLAHKRAFAFYRATFENQKRIYNSIFSDRTRNFYFVQQASLMIDWAVAQIATPMTGQVSWVLVSPDEKSILTPQGICKLADITKGDKPSVYLGILDYSKFQQVAEIWKTKKTNDLLLMEVNIFTKEIIKRCGLLAPFMELTLEEFKSFKEHEAKEMFPVLASCLFPEYQENLLNI